MSEPASYDGYRVVSKYVADEKTTALEAREHIEERGTRIVTSSSALVALIVGLSAVALGQGSTLTNTAAMILLVVAIAKFMVAAGLGVFVHNSARSRKAASISTLRNFVADNCDWNGEERDVLRTLVDLDIDSIESLRRVTKLKAIFCNWALGIQACATLLFAAAVAVEIIAKISS